jgi:MFS family permease
MTTTTNALVRERAAGAARGRWLMLIVLLAGQFMALLDVTIVNVAMPTIGRTLHATGPNSSSWWPATPSATRWR